MSLRGTPVVAYAATGSINLTLPTGSQANDRAVLFAATAAGVANASLPAGWTSLSSNTGTTWNSVACTKLLDATDISNGYILVPSGYSTFDMNAGIAVFVGPLAVREFEALLAQGAGSNSQSTTSAVTSSDEIIYWVTNRSGGGTVAAPTVTPASGSAAVVAGPSGGANSNCKIATQSPPGGVLSVTYNGGSTLIWNGIQVVISNGGIAGGGVFSTPSLDGLGKFGQLKGGCNG
jgi:hypothetical protein